MLNQLPSDNALQALQHAISQGDYAADSLFRVFHGRGQTVPELNFLNIDYYPPCLFVVSYQEIEPNTLNHLLALIWQQATNSSDKVAALVYQQRAGKQTHSHVAYGNVPKPHIVTELNCRYQVDLLSHQNTGIFPDMRQGRMWLQTQAKNAKVLNLFAYTCAFSVVAMRSGAAQVVNMDMNKGVLRQGKINHQLNGIEHGVSYLPHDILKSFGKLKRLAPFDVIIIDPPSFQKGSFILTKDYQKILRRLPELVSPTTQLLLCANSPELSQNEFQALISQHAPEQLEYVTRLPSTAGFDEANPDKSLKALVYKVKSS